MPLQLKDLTKLNQIIMRIEAGRFDEIDVDSLLIYLRPYADRKSVFFEVANFVAHTDERNQGLAHQSITAFVDSMQYFQEYVSRNRTLDISAPFPAYIYRLFSYQALLVDQRRLKNEHKMSCQTLIRKIKTSFSIDMSTSTCRLLNNKGGVELIAALQFITSFIHSRAAFHIKDFHKDLKDVMRAQKIIFDEATWDARADQISLAILCLVSNVNFLLPDRGQASCRLGTESHYRLLNGQRFFPNGLMSSEPTSLGRLMILGEATVNSTNRDTLHVCFPLIETDLDPHEHCDPTLFAQEQASGDFGDCRVELINFTRDMSLSADYKLVRSDLCISSST